MITASGDPATSSIGWVETAAARQTLDAWCRGVGPVVYHTAATAAAAELPAGGIAVVSWNVNVGAGDLGAFVADLRAGKLSDGRPVEHFVLLLQEALRTGAQVPPRDRSHAGARRLVRGTSRIDVVRFARESGLSILYVPSMRNGVDADAPAEDRGNAILSTLPIAAPRAVELPFARQRRVAAMAALGGADSAVAVASVHLDPFVSARRLWVLGAAGARARQARAVVEALPASGPVVVGGDFNAWLGTDEPALREMTRLTGAEPQALEGTYATGAVLDFLFFRTPAAWRAAYERADTTYGSDHYPLVGWIQPG